MVVVYNIVMVPSDFNKQRSKGPVIAFAVELAPEIVYILPIASSCNHHCTERTV